MAKKSQISLILNVIIFLLAIAGSIFCFGEIYLFYTTPIEHGIKLIKFFTVQSNVLAGIVALLYIIFFVRKNKTNKNIPNILHILKYIVTIDLIITFLVVSLFLGFITEEGYFSLFLNANFFFHFLIPLLNFISFVFFENSPKLKFSYTFLGIIHVILYSIFYLIVVLFNFKDGQVSLYYDWYAFAQKGLLIALICALVVLSLSYLVSFLLYKIKSKNN